MPLAHDFDALRDPFNVEAPSTMTLTALEQLWVQP
jgi:hypothetical protein